MEISKNNYNFIGNYLNLLCSVQMEISKNNYNFIGKGSCEVYMSDMKNQR